MSIKFKQYTQFVSLKDEPTEEQIVEIFGLFKNNQKIDKLKADREKLKQDTAKKVADWRAKRAGKPVEDEEEEEIPAKNNQRRPMTPRNNAAGGRAAERDWTSNLATEDIDDNATRAEANRIIAKLKKQFNVSFDTKKNKDGTMTITMNNDYVSDNSHKDAGVVTPKNISDAIDTDFREYRRKGWTFTQPQRGSFTIGVPEEAMMEAATE